MNYLDELTIAQKISDDLASFDEDQRRRILSMLLPAHNTGILAIRNERERHLRREVIDPFLRGEAQSEDELREGVANLCARVSEYSDAIWSLHKQLGRAKHQPSIGGPRPRYRKRASA